MNKGNKTNVMRLLDGKKIQYIPHDYLSSGAISGVDAANALNLPYYRVFKTLVTVGKSGNHYVFDVPVDKELSLKKAAEAVNEKNIAMIKSKDLLLLTGYVHGGCSPIGMKKSFQTVFDRSALNCENIVFSAGKIGYFVEIPFERLKEILAFSVADIIE